MKRLILKLDEEDLEDFKNLLFDVMYLESPILNSTIAEQVLKQIEDK